MIESHDYRIRLESTGPKTAIVDGDEDSLPSLEVASPPEFGGPGGIWSPEHLFVASISTCLMTTFSAIADIARLEVLQYHDEPTGHLLRGDDRLYRMDRVTLRPKVVVSDESKVDQAMRLLEKAENVCLISRSVASEIRLEATVMVAETV
jgi:peroxiredoxin-like protein